MEQHQFENRPKGPIDFGTRFGKFPPTKMAKLRAENIHAADATSF